MLQTIHVYDETHVAALRDALAAALARHDERLDLVALGSRSELDAARAHVEVLFASRPPRDGWAGFARLRLIHLAGAGADGLLPSPDLSSRVAVAGARGLFAAEASEHVIAALLAWSRASFTVWDRQRERAWRSFAVERLAGSTLCVVGLGAIGSRVVRVASALEMRVRGVCREARTVVGAERVWSTDDRVAAMEGAQHLALCVPSTEATRGLVGTREIGALARGAFVVSVSRSPVIDASALRSAIEAGHVGGASLDCFDTEPLPHDDPWWTTPNVFVTPHHAGFGRAYLERVAQRVVENARRLDAGEPLVGLVRRDRGY